VEEIFILGVDGYQEFAFNIRFDLPAES